MSQDECEPRHDARIAVEILDTVTGERVKTKANHSPYWWAEGNGSCDCNRGDRFDLDETAWPDGHVTVPDCSGGLCSGAKRFLIVAVEGDMGGYELWEFNEEYPPELIEEHLGVGQRRAMEAEDQRVQVAIFGRSDGAILDRPKT
jgi:hypothetical protein